MSNLLKASEINTFRKIAVIIMALVAMAVMTDFTGFSASADTLYSAPTMIAEKTYESTATHPYNKQTNTLIVNWNKTSDALKYELYIMGGQYTKWTKYKVTTATSVTVSNLKRTTEYKFKVRAVYVGNNYSAYSSVQTLKTARMDYDKAGWEAMCRIVYHEVGQIDSTIWDKPIVYVADCVTNQYVAAKYTNNKTWTPYYKKYTSIQQVIYNSGGFMSSTALTKDGAVYSKVPQKVKLAVWGAVYGKTMYKGIANDYNIYFWCNRSYYSNSSKIAYTFKIPWGYFNIWRTYWG